MFSKRYRIMLLFGIFILGISSYGVEKGEYFVSLVGREWKESTKIFPQPDGPFALIVFDDQFPVAGIIYYDIMGDPIRGAWKIDSRFWQEQEWADDINDFVWSPSGKYIYVATDITYGSGNLYRLDLLQKKYEKIFPTQQDINKIGFPESAHASYIESFDRNSQIMKIRLEIFKQGNTGAKPDKIIEKEMKLD